eukprot:352901-Chlamydomonas_euryale.AAC.12
MHGRGSLDALLRSKPAVACNLRADIAQLTSPRRPAQPPPGHRQGQPSTGPLRCCCSGCTPTPPNTWSPWAETALQLKIPHIHVFWILQAFRLRSTHSKPFTRPPCTSLPLCWKPTRLRTAAAASKWNKSPLVMSNP